MNYLEWRETHEKIMRHKLDEDGSLPYEKRVLDANLDESIVDASYDIINQTTESFISMKVMIEYLHENYSLNAIDLLFLDSIARSIAIIARREPISKGEINTQLTYIDHDFIKRIVTRLKDKASLEIDKTLEQLLLYNKMNPSAIWVKHPDYSVEERNGIDSMDQAAFRIDAESARKAYLINSTDKTDSELEALVKAAQIDKCTIVPENEEGEDNQ